MKRLQRLAVAMLILVGYLAAPWGARAASVTYGIKAFQTKPFPWIRSKTLEVSRVPTFHYNFVCTTPPHPLDCWLNLHPEIASHIIWQPPPGNVSLDWSEWDENRKAQLRKAFDDYAKWWDAGMTGFTGTEFADPLPNLINAQDGETAMLGMDEPTAWSVYLSTIALSLAAETHRWFAWSILGYEDEDLEQFFNSLQMFNYDPNHIYYPTFVGYVEMDHTPAPPTTVYAFFKDNDILQPTVLGTVGHMVGWLRNGSHMFGTMTTLNAQNHWGFRGPAPISRILEGTLITDPLYAHTHTTPEHWIDACYGSSEFLKFMLRAVNIPVRRIQVCNHFTPYFSTIDRYLDHGDDPYTSYSKSPPDFPGKDLLITGARFQNWFHGQTQWDDIPECYNVDRRPYELALTNLPDVMVDEYCKDVSQNKSHADGSVMEHYTHWYTVADLEAQNLWAKLSAKAQAQGKCQ